MSGAQLNGTDEDGNSLFAERLKVGDVFLGSASDKRAFTAAGAIRLSGAHITGVLDMSGAQLNGTDEDGQSLAADGVKIGGDVFLRVFDKERIFTAKGAVSLRDAHVGGSLDLVGAVLLGDESASALNVEGIHITRVLVWQPAQPVHASVSLKGATAAELQDNWEGRENGFWPIDLQLDGFNYTRIDTGAMSQKATVKRRLKWIRGRYEKENLTGSGNNTSTTTGSPQLRVTFASQPYEQLAYVYRRAGRDTEAREVAVARRRDLRRWGSLRWYRKAFNWFLDKAIQYGYQTWRALVWLVVLYGAIVAISFIAQHHVNAIVPAKDTARIHPMPSALHCTSGYPCFYPAGYGFDTVVPIINIHQAENWRPNSNVAWGDICLWCSWSGTVLGWLLVTLAVAGYTGLARRVDAN
jgi:hypothetical protein